MTTNADQAAFWGGDAGDTWVAQQTAMDQVLLPVLQGVMARADLAEGEAVLDVGCGTGQSTVMAAQAVGEAGHVLGADISEPMLALARKRSAGMAQARYVRADAAHHGFEPQSFDIALSRFGVMFFEDTQTAFANIRQALKPGGRVVFATWGQIEHNPWFTLPARVARAVIGSVPKSDPDAPGPFALRDPDHVIGVLEAAGFTDVAVDVADLSLSLPDGPAAMADVCLHIGPAAKALGHFESDAADRARLRSALTDAIAALPGGIIPAEINFFICRA